MNSVCAGCGDRTGRPKYCAVCDLALRLLSSYDLRRLSGQKARLEETGQDLGQEQELEKWVISSTMKT